MLVLEVVRCQSPGLPEVAACSFCVSHNHSCNIKIMCRFNSLTARLALTERPGVAPGFLPLSCASSGLKHCRHWSLPSSNSISREPGHEPGACAMILGDHLLDRGASQRPQLFKRENQAEPPQSLLIFAETILQLCAKYNSRTSTMSACCCRTVSSRINMLRKALPRKKLVTN